MLSALGPATAMVIDALTFLAAAALLYELPAMVPERAARGRAPSIVAAFERMDGLGKTR